MTDILQHYKMEIDIISLRAESQNTWLKKAETFHNADQAWSPLMFTGSMLLCACNDWVVPEFRLKPCLRSLSLLRPSRHGAKNSCWRASSAPILTRGFTAKHLSTRSKRAFGISSRNSGLFVFVSHQSCSFMDGKHCVL